MAGEGHKFRRADDNRRRETLSPEGPSTDRSPAVRTSCGGPIGLSQESVADGAGFAPNAGEPRRFAAKAGAIAGQGGHSHITIEGTSTLSNHAF